VGAVLAVALHLGERSPNPVAQWASRTFAVAFDVIGVALIVLWILFAT
jgi:hypothetical protein